MGHWFLNSLPARGALRMNILFLTYDYLTQPLGIAYLSGALLEAGHATQVAALHDGPRQKALLRDFQPDVLCLSLITGQHPLFFQAAGKIKKAFPKISVLAGGPHPTFYPECIHENVLDAVCRGEGETALPAMVNGLAETGSLPATLQNWWIKRPDGSVIKNDVGPLLDDLGRLPQPDRAMFDRAQPGVLRRTVYVMTSRGCPYQCSYCFNHAYNKLYDGKGRLCRRRSVGSVLEEIGGLKRRYPLQIIVFQDDTFNLDRQWLAEFAERYPLETGVPFHCHLRADLLDSETAAMLRRAGCLSVKLGLESGRDHVRNGILNRGMSLEQFETACALLRKSGIRFATENILAIPGSTFEDDLCTYGINRRVRPQHSFATLMQVYPRTRIAEFAAKSGCAEALANDFPHTFYEDSAMSLEHKVARGRLRALFALGVSLNVPVPVIRVLAGFRLRGFYEFIDRLWKGYCLRFRIYPYRQSVFDFMRETAEYLRNKHY